MPTDFHALSKKESNSRLKLKYLALAHFHDGISRYQIASALRVSRTSVNKWVSAYLTEGLDGLKPKKSTGRPSRLSLEQLEEIKAYIDEQSASEEGGRLTGKCLQDYISTTFGISYGLTNTYKILHELGFCWITSRSRHPKQSQEKQDFFKTL